MTYRDLVLGELLSFSSDTWVMARSLSLCRVGLTFDA